MILVCVSMARALREEKLMLVHEALDTSRAALGTGRASSMPGCAQGLQHICEGPEVPTAPSRAMGIPTSAAA